MGVTLNDMSFRQPGLKLALKKGSIFGIVTIFFTTSYNPHKGIRAMKANVIIDQEMQKVKLILDWKSGIVGQNLTIDEAEDVVKLIDQALREASREVFAPHGDSKHR